MSKIVIIFALFCTLFLSSSAKSLEEYNIDPSGITVSGLSAGGAFAVQFHYAFSRMISGAGIFAGLPYSCAKGGLMYATQCMTIPLLAPSVTVMLNEARSQASQGKIDDLKYLQGQKAYIFHGKMDFTVVIDNEKRIKEMYENLGVQVFSETSYSASHGYPTDHYGAACGSTSGSTQYINNCGYKGIYHMLNYLYDGDLAEPDNTVSPPGELYEFDQTEFFTGSPSLDTVGYAYIPSGCKDKTVPCRLHIAFHGCLQSKSNAGVGNAVATKTGYIQAAELNNIIMLFPQAKSTLISNPNACFEWWPYVNANFINKSGVQMAAIHKMMMRVLTGQ